ncbi:MAG: gliding motility-associated C-terminal domain-containing protein [Cyclobacteriaceae bacterium]|nr:gliding motility-associated C-terminal domain-containing protein [Cyclobacteriaceae bacterium]
MNLEMIQESAITDSALVIDGDGDKLQKAIISISTNYIKNEDSLFYEPGQDLNFQWNNTAGVLTVLGVARPEVYEEVIRSLKYINLKRLAPNTLKRDIDIVLFDADTNSITYRREILFKNSFIDLDIPSAFTPNDDGVNDTWIITNLDQYEDSNIYIFARTGQKIFETKAQRHQWDGSSKGSSGASWYLLLRRFQIPKYEKVYKGTLTVLR